MSQAKRRRDRGWSRYPTPQEITVLRALIRGGAMRGVEIAECVRGAIAGGHVYVLVQRLRRKGAIARHRMIDNPVRGGPRVPIWKITAWGRRTVRAMAILTGGPRHTT